MCICDLTTNTVICRDNDCCQDNTTHTIQCSQNCNDSIVVEITIGAVAALLLLLLLVSCCIILVLGRKLKRSQQKGRYESEQHQYVQQQIGQ